MTKLESLLQEYGESHDNPVNQKVHWLCVPLVEWSLLGFFWCLPTPEWMQAINWAHIVCFFALCYYLQFKSWKVVAAAFGIMLPFWIYISFHPPQVFATSVILFILARVGQLYGHKVEGKRPTFLRDIFFLLIGPLWVVHHFRRLT